MKLAVCSHDEPCLSALTQLLEHWLRLGSVNAEVVLFSNAETFLNEYDPGAFCFVFIDAALPDLPGLMLAKRIRSTGDNAQLVFLSDSAQPALACYETHPAGFFLKPVRYERLAELLQWYRTLFLPAMRSVTVICNRAPRRILLCDIQYIDVSGRTSSIHLKGETVLTNRTLNFLASELSDAAFFRCHRSYLVNPAFVLALQDRTLVLANGEKIPVSEDNLSFARKLVQDRREV